jgi:hypothetical protein
MILHFWMFCEVFVLFSHLPRNIVLTPTSPPAQAMLTARSPGIFWQLVERVCIFSNFPFKTHNLWHAQNSYTVVASFADAHKIIDKSSNADLVIVQLQPGCRCWQPERRFSPNYSDLGLSFLKSILSLWLTVLRYGYSASCLLVMPPRSSRVILFQLPLYSEYSVSTHSRYPARYHAFIFRLY